MLDFVLNIFDKHIKPSLVVKGGQLTRWHLLPRNKWFNLYLHKITRKDSHAHPHDHPWDNITYVLKGWYAEEIRGSSQGRLNYQGDRVERKAHEAHSIDMVSYQSCWTLFVAFKRKREWGFWVGEKWVHWEDYVQPNNTGEVREEFRS